MIRVGARPPSGRVSSAGIDPREQLPRFVARMLARSGPLPEGAGWAFEVKFDDIRAQLRWDGPLDVSPLAAHTRAKPAGSVVPLKFQLCTSSGTNRSSASIEVNAEDVILVSTQVTGPVDDAGNANPDSNFRFELGLGDSGGYIYNLSTRGKGTGT